MHRVEVPRIARIFAARYLGGRAPPRRQGRGNRQGVIDGGPEHRTTSRDDADFNLHQVPDGQACDHDCFPTSGQFLLDKTRTTGVKTLTDSIIGVEPQARTNIDVGLRHRCSHRPARSVQYRGHPGGLGLEETYSAPTRKAEMASSFFCRSICKPIMMGMGIISVTKSVTMSVPTMA